MKKFELQIDVAMGDWSEIDKKIDLKHVLSLILNLNLEGLLPRGSRVLIQEEDNKYSPAFEAIKKVIDSQIRVYNCEVEGTIWLTEDRLVDLLRFDLLTFMEVDELWNYYCEKCNIPNKSFCSNDSCDDCNRGNYCGRG